MRTVSFYDKDTGMFHGAQLTTTDDALISPNTPADHVALDGKYDPLSQKVDVATGQVVDYQPPQPSPLHVWNAQARRWQLSDAAAAAVKAKAAARSRIAQLEASQPRAVREILLGRKAASVRLREIDDEIAELRKHL